MTGKLKTLVLLIIVVHYGFDEAVSGWAALSIGSPTGSTIPELVNYSENIALPYVQPVKTLPAPVQIVGFGSVAVRLTAQQRLFYRELVYARLHDIFSNHPITSYKISLSAHTADG